MPTDFLPLFDISCSINNRALTGALSEKKKQDTLCSDDEAIEKKWFNFRKQSNFGAGNYDSPFMISNQYWVVSPATVRNTHYKP